MTSNYRRDHITDVRNDEYERLGSGARSDIQTLVNSLAALYPTPPASNGENTALRRALARYLIDSGKASAAGQV